MACLLKPCPCRGYATLPNTVREGIRLKCWKIMPIFLRAARRSLAESAVKSCPATKTLPELGRSKRLMHRTSVDLPAPEKPMIPKISPEPMESDTSRTVAGNVAYPLKGSGLSKEDIQKKVATLLELVGIGDKADAYPSQLSGGQKQRVAIARALANDPQVLLCDEATSALDPQTTKAILHLLKHLNETLGITIVLITHEMAVVKEICDRVAVMEYGRVVEQGEVFTVFAEPKQDITKSFIHTTSNLQKVEELIAEDSPVTRLQPGELIVRLSYVQRNVNEPIISAVSQMFNVSLNIIFADITIVQDSPIGGTVAIISGERKQITKAIEYLIEKNVGVEVIKDARADR